MQHYTIKQTDDALVVDGAGEPVDLWNALRRHFLRKRESRRGSGGLRYPETTRRDVLGVVAIFNRELARAPRNLAGLDVETVKWRKAAKRVASAGGADDAIYDDNAGFWLRHTKRLAVYLTVARFLPSRTKLLQGLAEMKEAAP